MTRDFSGYRGEELIRLLAILRRIKDNPDARGVARSLYKDVAAELAYRGDIVIRCIHPRVPWLPPPLYREVYPNS